MFVATTAATVGLSDVQVGTIVGTIIGGTLLIGLAWRVFSKMRAWQIELDGDGIPIEEGGHKPLRLWRRDVEVKVDTMAADIAASKTSLDSILQMAQELVPNHGGSFRDEYREDRALNRAMWDAIADHVGLPPSSGRTLRRSGPTRPAADHCRGGASQRQRHGVQRRRRTQAPISGYAMDAPARRPDFTTPPAPPDLEDSRA